MNKQELLARRDYFNMVHGVTVRAIGAFTDEELTSARGRRCGRPGSLGTYPAWQYFNFAYDEHWHHRGQLYSYLRLLGKEPPMLYDYGAGES
jgi:uncharacterized damage-inducible protein DinB